MKFVHLQTMALRGHAIVRPAGALGTHGAHAGVAWRAAWVPIHKMADKRYVRQAWNTANPQLVAASVDEPIIGGSG